MRTVRAGSAFGVYLDAHLLAGPEVVWRGSHSKYIPGGLDAVPSLPQPLISCALLFSSTKSGALLPSDKLVREAF